MLQGVQLCDDTLPKAFWTAVSMSDKRSNCFWTPSIPTAWQM